MAVGHAFSIVWGATCRALMPVARKLPDNEEVKRRRVLARLTGHCIYCGDAAHTTDHFQPVVALDGMPTGYCSDAWNVVPCCTTCNSSKSNMSWRRFLSRTNGKAPLSRGVPDLAARRVVLEAFDRLHRKHAQRWSPSDWTPQLQRLRTGMEAAFKSHGARTSRLRNRIRSRCLSDAVVAAKASCCSKRPRKRTRRS